MAIYNPISKPKPIYIPYDNPRTRIIKKEPEESWSSWIYFGISLGIDLVAWGLGIVAGAVATAFTASPAVGYLVATGVQAVSSIIGNFLLDYFTDNLFDKDGNVKWTNVILNVLPALGTFGSKFKQGLRALKQEKIFIKLLKQSRLPLPIISALRKDSKVLLDINGVLKEGIKNNDVNFVKRYLSEAKSANFYKLRKRVKGIIFSDKELRRYSNMKQVNLIATRIQETQKIVKDTRSAFKGKVEQILSKRGFTNTYKTITKGLNIVRFLNPAYTARIIVKKTLAPIEKVLRKKITPLLKNITKKTRHMAQLYLKHGIIPVNSSVIFGYRVSPVATNYFQIEFFFRGEETRFKKPVVSRPLSTQQFISWTNATSPMNWYLDNIAFSRGGRNKNGGTLFGSIANQVGNFAGFSRQASELGKWAYTAFRVYRAYNYVKKFGTRNKKWQGWDYLKSNVSNQYSNFDFSGYMKDRYTKESVRKGLAIIGVSGLFSRLGTQLLSKDNKKRTREKRTNTAGKLTYTTISYTKNRIAGKIRRGKFRRKRK